MSQTAARRWRACREAQERPPAQLRRDFGRPLLAPPARLDQALLLPGIADCAAGDIQPGRQCCVRNATPIPNDIDEVVFADDALPVADQVIEQIEHLWRDGDDVRPAMQLAPLSVERVLLEEIAQDANPLG
jgi:hypothetical protein